MQNPFTKKKRAEAEFWTRWSRLVRELQKDQFRQDFPDMYNDEDLKIDVDFIAKRQAWVRRIQTKENK